jgi:2-hydroxymuconate-semialdehyde hydrolase
MRIAFRTVNDALTRYYDAGAGYPIVLLHGTAMTAEVWIENIPVLARQNRVIAPDLLGCGFTEPGRYRGGPPHPHMLDHLTALFDELDLKSFVLGGSSFGALLALLLHLRMPERIPGLLLVSSGSAVNTDEQLERAYEGGRQNGRAVFENPSYENCIRRMRNIVGPDVVIPEALLFAQMTSYALPGALQSFEQRREALLDLDSWRAWRAQPHLDKITARTLAVFGSHDPRANLESAGRELAKIRDCTLLIFDNVRHYPQLENPQRFNKHVQTFLAALPALEHAS